MSEWFIPEPEDFPSQRALLHLGLNKAARYYRELVVPGIGGAWFVRQLSWAMGGIVLAKELHLKPSKIANAIEALACKLEWNNSENEDDYDGKGIRAFNRDGDDVWGFKELSDKKHYVQITYRMSTVRALTGLGLTTGTRFNTMELTQIGNAFVEDFLNQNKGGRGGKIVRNALTEWIQGSLIDKIEEGIGKRCVTGEEKQIIRNRLLSDSSDTLSNSQRRKYLIETFGHNTVNMPDLDVILKNLKQQDHVNDIETAIAFDAMLERGRKIIHKCAELIAVSQYDIKGLTSSIKILKSKIEAYKKSKGKKHSDSDSFSTELLATNNDTELLNCIVKRDGNILMFSNGKIIKGTLFDNRKELIINDKTLQEQVGSEESSTENKLHQLFELWTDCQ